MDNNDLENLDKQNIDAEIVENPNEKPKNK